MKVALVLDPGFTALDVVGPLQVLAAAPGVETMLVAHELGSVADDTAHCPMIATATLSDVPAPEVVVVPGSELSLDLDPEVVDWLRKATRPPPGPAAWASARPTSQQPASWPTKRPPALGLIHTDRRGGGPLVEPAGGSSKTAASSSPPGQRRIDMALTLLGLSHGPAVVLAVQLAIEYDPEPPYDAGSPTMAPHQIRDLVTSYYAQRI